ncbi:MAG: hypothetical protein K5790_07215 [Nitrosopumilus sp.]|uniref:hypothetical protein n=1 Tax=Nitrosopumilus sp. TaxID=2024843 RepID=UPI00247CDB45|nr:hypothetical protein [Nitrosopumilus sp.]MCV0393063.1 hypothetical protein [Nitrosopumilus sp.]
MVIFREKKIPGLLSYKYYIRPIAHQLYGKSSLKSKHQENVQRILKILALNGPMTTWEMAKVRFSSEMDKIRTKEKEYRRLLVGRVDKGKRSEGILDLHLVVVDSISTKRNPGNKYRLSLYGILYCLDVMDFTEKQIDTLVRNYENLLPLVFGNWEMLKSQIRDSVYNISLLGKGLLFDNLNILKIENKEFYELISFFNIKSNTLSHSFNEEKIGEMISLWFFITLLYFPILLKKIKRSQNYLKKVLDNDPKLKKWFSDFMTEAQEFYKDRLRTIERISIT